MWSPSSAGRRYSPNPVRNTAKAGVVIVIPTTVQTIVREALEPALLIVPNMFQTINLTQGRHVQIGAVGAMVAREIPETSEYPTQDLDIDGGMEIAPTNSTICWKAQPPVWG